VGQIYLKDNPLLQRPLTLDDISRASSAMGTTPGLTSSMSTGIASSANAA